MNNTQRAKNAIKWAKALKSGKFKKGTNYLGNDEIGYCCLGVGLLTLLGLKGSGKLLQDNDQGSVLESYENFGLLSPIGDTDMPRTYEPDNRLFDCLTDLNDQAAVTHPEIGRLLLERPEWVFVPEVAAEIKRLTNQGEK